MAKETTIKISKEFKGFLQGEKQEGEYFEETINRLINVASIPLKTAKKQYTERKYTENKVDNEEIVFTNISDFNLEVARRKFLEPVNTDLEVKEEWKEIPIEVSDPLSENGVKIIMKKYREINDGATIKILSLSLPTKIQEALNEEDDLFLNLPKEESNFEIKILPPKTILEIIEHQRSFR